MYRHTHHQAKDPIKLSLSIGDNVNSVSPPRLGLSAVDQLRKIVTVQARDPTACSNSNFNPTNHSIHLRIQCKHKKEHLMTEPEQRIIVLKPYSAKELAAMYGVDKRTFLRWLTESQPQIGPRKGRFYIIPQVKVIFIELGVPVNCYVEGLRI